MVKSNGDEPVTDSTYFQPSSPLVLPPKTLASVALLNHTRGAGESSTPLASVMVAVKVLLLVRDSLIRGVYVMEGGVRSLGVNSPSSAPMSGAVPEPA